MDINGEECSVVLGFSSDMPTELRSNTDTNHHDAGSVSNTAEAYGKKRCNISTDKLYILSVFAMLIILIVIDSSTTGYVEEGASDFLDWMKKNPILGVFAFIAIYALATG